MKLFCTILLFGSVIIGAFGHFASTNEINSGPSSGRAIQMKNRVKGPADLGIYFVNSPGAACGGLKLNQCSQDCGALGYPVYWCYPKVCYCHFGSSPNEEEVGLPE